MTAPEALARAHACLQAGDAAGAGVTLEEFLRASPKDGAAWFLLGAVRHRLGQAEAAYEAFSLAAKHDRRHLESRYALAAVCLELGRPDDALVPCREAVLLAPGEPKAWFSLGVAQEACGLASAALDSYERTLSLQPAHVEALTNRGALLLAFGRTDEAVANNRDLAARQPYSFGAQFNLGDSLLRQQRYVDAAAALGRAIRLSPKSAKALLHGGFALAQCERFAEAQRLLDQARALDPGMIRAYRQSIFGDDDGDVLDARALFLLRHYDAIERCDWRENDHFRERFSVLINDRSAAPLTEKALGFRAMAVALLAADQLTLARQIAAGVAARLPPAAQLPAPARPPAAAGRRLRIAYLSQDFRVHPTGLLTAGLYGWHDRQRFEVFAYSLAAGDGSAAHARIVAGCDSYVDIAALDDAAAAARIAADAPDILVDLCGYADRSRPGILARRPAPLQLSWLAYMATMGAPWIDYLVGDHSGLAQGCDAGYSEALIRLPAQLYLCSYAEHRPDPAPARAALGLPAAAPVAAAMHNPYKIDPAVFSAWMQILRAVPAAVLWLADAQPEATANLRQAAAVQGVDPSRLVFSPRVDNAAYLARLQCADLFLDSFRYNGGTTVADALVAGVPVLTCAGSALPQRMGLSLLAAAGMDDFVVADTTAYVALATSLLAQPAALQAARQRLQAARDEALFFRPQAWVRSFERGLELIWQRHCAGLPPAAIDVAA